jgi:hypothetical protein
MISAVIAALNRERLIGEDIESVLRQVGAVNEIMVVDKPGVPNEATLKSLPTAFTAMAPRCREMILVDYSKLVGNWRAKYLQGKGHVKIQLIDKPAFPNVASNPVDFAFANGVFEHVDTDDTDCFLTRLADLDAQKPDAEESETNR